MKLKYFFVSAVLVAMGQVWAVGSVKQTEQKPIASDVDAPAYSIAGKDTTCQIFLYSPAPNQGLHLAYLTDDERWVDVGQLCASDYGPWGAEKKMYNPCVVKAHDGTWRALWGVNDKSPQFAVAYSEDLVTWRPQDYPIVHEIGVKSPVAYQMDDGTFDIYLKTSQGKRYVQASNDFRTFKEDSLEASADEILWQKDSALINGKIQPGDEFEVPLLHLNYIRSWFKALAEDNRENARQMPKNANDLANLLREKGYSGEIPQGDIVANLQIESDKVKRIYDKLIGIFFEDISMAADGGLNAELLQNGDFEYHQEDGRRSWNAATAWKRVTTSASGAQGVATISTDNGVSKNNPHYAIVGVEPIFNVGWDGISIKRGDSVEGKDGKHQPYVYDVSFCARCLDCKQKQVVVALVDKEGTVVCQAKVKVQGADWTV